MLSTSSCKPYVELVQCMCVFSWFFFELVHSVIFGIRSGGSLWGVSPLGTQNLCLPLKNIEEPLKPVSKVETRIKDCPPGSSCLMSYVSPFLGFSVGPCPCQCCQCRLNSLARRNLFWSGGGWLVTPFEGFWGPLEGSLMAPWWPLEGPLRALVCIWVEEAPFGTVWT